jgi:serine/threonine protein kinase/tetratricopeptide (TPR) repeat protein
MNLIEFSGVTDSPGSIRRESHGCARCNTTTRLLHGICLQCLFQEALSNESDPSEAALIDALAHVELKAAKWRIGDYEILDEIGRGGMGVIYRAREAHSHRVVALKRVLTYHADSDQTLARFRREAETATRLDHPNIIPVYYVGQDEEGLPFFTMKFAPGGSLSQAREIFRSDPHKSVSLMMKVAFAVDYAHGRGVLHRDLKPSNILLDSRWEPMVSDFGLAKWLQESTDITRTLTVFGTPGYIAPEQAARPAMRVTPAADIYNLGAMLFELLGGRSPFVGDHALAVLQQAVEQRAPPLRSIARHLDRDLETICARCLEREPSARYSSAGALAHDLQNWLEQRPIDARPVSIAVSSWRWCRRNRILATTVAALLLLISATLPLVNQSYKLREAKQEATLAAHSVAVLPFLNLDTVAFDEKLAQSIGDFLQHELGRSGRVKIMPSPASGEWETVEQVQKVGLAAKTRTVLIGTKRTVDRRTRICLRLIDPGTGETLLVRFWEGSSETDSKLPIGREIGTAIHNFLIAKDWSNLTQPKIDPGLRSQTAREAILAGRELVYRYDSSNLDKGIELLEKAVRLAPDSSLAHSNLAMAVTVRTHFVSDRNFLQLGEAEAHEALRLSPDSSDAHRALAGVLYQQGEFAEALEQGLSTVEFSGPDERIARFIGTTLNSLGQPEKALAWDVVASELGGRWGDEYGLLGDSWAQLCDDGRALQAYHRAAQLQPDPPKGEIGICHILLLQGDVDGARQLCRSTLRNNSRFSEAQQMAAQIEFFSRRFDVAADRYGGLMNLDPLGGGAFYGAITYQSALGRARQALGDEQGAKTILEDSLVNEIAAVNREPRNPEAAYRLAAVEASLGFAERSIKHLRNAVALGWVDYRSLIMDPRFDAVRNDSRVQAISKDLAGRMAEMRMKAQTMNYGKIEVNK